MKLLVAGGSGFIGKHLIQYLQAQKHDVTLLTRQHDLNIDCPVIHWDGTQLNETEQCFDAIINLCGNNITASRWNTEVKKDLVDSRIIPTNAIAEHIKKYYANKPLQLLNASAIGIYPSDEHGQTEDKIAKYTEATFPQELVKEWEEAALKAASGDHHVSCLRFGVVLGLDGGLLKKLTPTYKLGLGVIMGDGDNHMSWIHIKDLCSATDWVLKNPQAGASSTYNITAPQPCTQEEFSNDLAHCFFRPRILTMPPYTVKLLFGQLGKELLLTDHLILPHNLQEAGFTFGFESIDAALTDLIHD